MENVSIITISHLHRFDCLKILLTLIKNQKYKNIKEWIIIEGSKTESEADIHKDYITNFINENSFNNNITIRYLPYVKEYIDDMLNNNSEKLINYGINNSISDLIIIMNNDDFYLSTYIEHCVDKLSDNYKAICNTLYVYDIIIDKACKLEGVTDIYAYRKNANNLNISILTAEKLMIKIIHNENKFFPKYLTLLNSIDSVKLSDNINKIDNIFIDFIIKLESKNSENYIDLYKNIFINENDHNYDITYFTGGLGVVWNPSDNNLGGSEQAIINLAENWAKLGKSVVVYGNFIKQNENINNVDYIHWTKFPFEKKLKTLIVWRKTGMILLFNNNFKAKNIILDFHDNFFIIDDLNPSDLKKFFDKINYINLKSNYHYESFIEFLKKKNIENNYSNKVKIINNGVRIDKFLDNKYNAIRNPYRFCYCSSYDRGLDIILTKIWPLIYSKEPRAELHVYYGMDYITDNNFKVIMKMLLSLPGVMDHGRQSQEIITREKYLSSFHLYINNCIAEIDCISIKESLVTGCIPIISNFGVFSERDGLHYNWDPNNDELCNLITLDIINKMNDEILIENIRNSFKNSKTLINWNMIAEKWLELM